MFAAVSNVSPLLRLLLFTGLPRLRLLLPATGRCARQRSAQRVGSSCRQCLHPRAHP